MTAMRYRMLGPLRIGEEPIAAAQPRMVFAILLSEMGRAVSTERLIDEIWGDRPPRAAVGTIQGYVMRLRRLIGGSDVLVTRGRGYELVADAGEVDAGRFEQRIAAGRLSLAAGRLERAVEELTDGLGLWRGSALADVAPCTIVTAESLRLDEARLTAMESRLGAQLELGRHADVVDDLHRLVREHPLREQLCAHLILALVRCGRRGEALEAYRRIRERLVDELGIEPGQPLRDLQRAVLTEDPRLAAPDPRAVAIADRPDTRRVPAELPADAPDFTGRAAELARLDALLPAAGGDPAGVVLISTVAGAAGVGKTALAVRWAHRVSGRFPDGQLHLDLRGHAAGPPVRTGDAVARLLRSLGVRAQDVPDDVEEAAALYRTTLAGRRVLIVLDNARDADQVRPLLPGRPGCLALITSRARLSGLVARNGAVPLILDVLTPAEAHRLLARLLGEHRPDIDTSAPHGPVAQLAALCGYLPLALRIAAAQLVTDPRLPIGGYLDELAGDDRLAGFELGDDPQAGVQIALDHSYAALPDDARRLFRLLGLVPGPQFTAPAVAALADLPRVRAARLLDLLAAAHLIDEHAAGRYSFHDLVRDHAAGRAATDPEPARRGALTRLLDFYVGLVLAAGDHLFPQLLRAEAGRAAGFAGPAEASGWLDTEHQNLVAAVTHGPPDGAWRLADALRGHLYMRMNTQEWLAVARAGLAAAEKAGEPQAGASGRIGLATVFWAQGRHADAAELFAQALPMAREAGWREGEAAALGNLGNLSWALGRLDAAAGHYTRAGALYRTLGQAAAEANALGNLGLVHFGLGRLEDAVTQYARALDLHRETSAPGARARTLTNLGAALHAMGRLDEARATLAEARELLDTIGDRNVEGDALRNLAAVHRDAGRLTEALEMARAAAELARDGGDQRLRAGAETTLASIHCRLGSFAWAVEGHRRARRSARAADSRYLEAEALAGLAEALRASGEPEGAAEAAREASTIARADGYRLLVLRCENFLATGP